MGLHSVNYISSRPLWRTWTITLFISVAKKAQPQAVLFQMAIYVFGKSYPFFVRT